MEITKEMYEKIAHLLPKQKSPPKISNLEVLNAILNVLENGSKWHSLGKNWRTIYTRANRWAKNNVLERIFVYLQKQGIIARKEYCVWARHASKYIRIHMEL